MKPCLLLLSRENIIYYERTPFFYHVRDTHATKQKNKKKRKKNLLIRGKAIECITRPSQVITRPIYPCITRSAKYYPSSECETRATVQREYLERVIFFEKKKLRKNSKNLQYFYGKEHSRRVTLRTLYAEEWKQQRPRLHRPPRRLPPLSHPLHKN